MRAFLRRDRCRSSPINFRQSPAIDSLRLQLYADRRPRQGAHGSPLERPDVRHEVKGRRKHESTHASAYLSVRLSTRMAACVVHFCKTASGSRSHVGANFTSRLLSFVVPPHSRQAAGSLRIFALLKVGVAEPGVKGKELTEGINCIVNITAELKKKIQQFAHFKILI